MKKGIPLLLWVSIFIPCLTITQDTTNKIDQIQKLLTSMNQTIGEFSTCVLKGNCTSEKQKKISTYLKESAKTLGTFMINLLSTAKARIIGEQKEATVPRL